MLMGVGCGRASGRTCLANLSALGVARGPRLGVGSSRIARVVLKPAKPPAHRVRSVWRRRVALADPRATPAGVRLSVRLAADVPGECVPVSGRLATQSWEAQ